MKYHSVILKADGGTGDTAASFPETSPAPSLQPLLEKVSIIKPQSIKNNSLLKTALLILLSANIINITIELCAIKKYLSVL
ncbi:hypothetical protein [Bacillus sp. AK031]